MSSNPRSVLRLAAAAMLAALLAACESAPPPPPEREPGQPAPAPVAPPTPPQGKVTTAPMPGKQAAAPLPPQRINTVRAAQERLTALGYDVGAVDGLSGRRTLSALREFQRDRGLPATGLLDAATTEALGKATAR